MFTANAGFDTKIGSAGFPRYLEWPPFDFYAELSGGTSRLRHAIVMTTKPVSQVTTMLRPLSSV